LPILQRLSASGRVREPKCPRALILAPTRELAIQVEESFRRYGIHLPLRSACIFGGVSDVPQKAALSRGVDILVATPGRLLDLVQQKMLYLNHLEIFVLDEADRMLDMGFVRDIKKILSMLPPKRQNLFFSATMPREISQLAATIFKTTPIRIEVTPESRPVERIRQTVYAAEKKQKATLLKQLLLENPGMNKVLVFCRTKHGADKVCKVLDKAGITGAAIHGNKSQTRRQEALGNFKDEKIRVLVATDIAARGIDVDQVTHVFNYDLPETPETYVHRIGRTARAGKEGSAIAFCSNEERPLLRAIEKLTKVSIPFTEHAIPKEDAPATPAPTPRKKKSGNKKPKQAPANPHVTKPENQSPVKTAGGHRPGSRARKRMREVNSASNPPRPQQ
jgi:ATP-dependent RNA helicase RhlE